MCWKQPNYSELLTTGLYDGESSIVYVYLLLYELTGQEEWMEYAQKHFGIVRRLIPKDQNMDYLTGNAGAIAVALKLYKVTGRTEY